VADAPFTSPENSVQRALRRDKALWDELATWLPHWRELSQYQQPRIGRYLVEDNNNGHKRNNSILDNTALFAHRTLASGLMSGMSSPARPWFALTLRDKKLAARRAVKEWLFTCAEILRAIFASSNTYRALHALYGELGLIGTGVSIVAPDFANVIHHFPVTAGAYALGTDFKGQVNTLTRRFKLKTAQMVQEFGYAACSEPVKGAWREGAFDRLFDVHHIIEPRELRDPGKKDARNMPWASCYYEPSASRGRWLRESGMQRFRVLAPRWEVVGEDTYGRSPGMDCLGDTKQLQQEQLRKSQAIDYQSNPPVQVPSAYKNQDEGALLPGGRSYVDQTSPSGGIRTAFDVPLDLSHLREDIEDVRGRIRAAYYADLFLMLMNDTRSGVTATEIAERHEEKLLMLGPVLERLHNELFQPLIDISFDEGAAARIFPTPPDEVRGQEIAVEFISTLAQAQRMVTAGAQDRLLTSATNLAAMWPEVRHKIKPLRAVERYAEMFGTDPSLLADDDEVEAAVAEDARQQKLQQAAAAMPAVKDATTAAQALGNTDGANVRDIMNQFTGYNSPSAQSLPV
jgi:hypothetical protein